MAIRGLMRSVHDCADDSWLSEDSAQAVLDDLAATCRELAAGVDAFGELVRNEADVQADLSRATSPVSRRPRTAWSVPAPASTPPWPRSSHPT